MVISKTKVLIIIFVSLCVVLSIGTCCVILFLLVVPFSGQSSSKSSHYKYLKFNPSTNTLSHGFMDISGISKDNIPQQSYFDSSNSHILITPFGSQNQEYICHGTCICEDSSRRNIQGARILSKSLVLLVSALTSTYAIQLAKEQFDRTCQDLHHSSCDTVVSDSRQCVLSEASDIIDRLITKKAAYRDSSESSKEREQVFKCRGYCYTTNQASQIEQYIAQGEMEEPYIKIFRDNYESLQGFGEEFGCEEMMLEMVVQLDVDEIRDDPFMAEGEEGKIYSPGKVKDSEFVKRKFLHNHLNQYCIHESQQRMIIENRWGDDFRSEMSFCAGYNDNFLNENIECVVVEDFDLEEYSSSGY